MVPFDIMMVNSPLILGFICLEIQNFHFSVMFFSRFSFSFADYFALPYSIAVVLTLLIWLIPSNNISRDGHFYMSQGQSISSISVKFKSVSTLIQRNIQGMCRGDIRANRRGWIHFPSLNYHITMTSCWAQWRLKSPASWLFAIIQAWNKIFLPFDNFGQYR